MTSVFLAFDCFIIQVRHKPLHEPIENNCAVLSGVTVAQFKGTKIGRETHGSMDMQAGYVFGQIGLDD